MAHPHDIIPEATCQRCGEAFRPRIKCKALYCSEPCRNSTPKTILSKPCARCGISYVPSTRNSVYCSDKCRIDPKKYRRHYPGVNISTGTVGSIGELFVAAKLMEKGWCVFRNLSSHGPIDLVAVKGESVRKIEVRVGRICPSTGNRQWKKWLRSAATEDVIIAVYFPQTGTVTFHKGKHKK